MAPLVRRTWAPRGERPVLLQKGSGNRGRERVSVAATIWLPPDRDHLGLHYQTLIDGCFNSFESAAYLRRLMKVLKGKVIVIWDGGTMHKGDFIHKVERECRCRLTIGKLPPYAPMLNPVEFLWGWMKYGQLSNFPPQDEWQMNDVATGLLEEAKHDQARLKSIVAASDLVIPRALLF